MLTSLQNPSAADKSLWAPPIHSQARHRLLSLLKSRRYEDLCRDNQGLPPLRRDAGATGLSPVVTNLDRATARSDEDLTAAMRVDVVPALAHPSYTYPIIRRKHSGVVNPQLRVYDVKGLSIADSSVLPLIPATYPPSMAYAVAEKATDIIKTGPKFISQDSRSFDAV